MYVNLRHPNLSEMRENILDQSVPPSSGTGWILPRGSVQLDHGIRRLLKGRNPPGTVRKRIAAVAHEKPVLARSRPSVRELDGREATKAARAAAS